MDPRMNVFLLAIFCALGVGYGFVPRAMLGVSHIIGGREIDISEIPYMASIRKFSEHFCGASIIGKHYLLTAAHCFQDRIWIHFYGVAAGSTHITRGANRFFVRSVHVHPKFDIKIIDYDIAVVGIRNGFNFDKKISPIVPVNAGSTLNPKNTLVVSGWGQTSESAENTNDELLKTEVRYIDQSKCQKLYADVDDGAVLTDRMFCAGVEVGDQDACHGDSGGPIVDFKSGKQVGIVSWGSGCGNPERPGVYTKLANSEIQQFIYKIARK